MLFHTALPHFKTSLPLLCMLPPTHISKFLWALSACFPWQVVRSGTSSVLLHDTGNRNCSIPHLCSSRNQLCFGNAGSGVDFWSSAASESKESSQQWIQGHSENDDLEWNCKCSCSVLGTLDSTSASTLKWSNELFAKPILLLLFSPKCTESF